MPNQNPKKSLSLATIFIQYAINTNLLHTNLSYIIRYIRLYYFHTFSLFVNNFFVVGLYVDFSHECSDEDTDCLRIFVMLICDQFVGVWCYTEYTIIAIV